jgi:DUF971 family protein
MAGLEKDTPLPTKIVVHSVSRALEVEFADGRNFRFPFEFLRVNSPSAEVRGHGKGQEVLQVGKRDVLIDRVEPVGQYAIQPCFSDGHESGIYSWDYLYWLGVNQPDLWLQYLENLAAAGKSRGEGEGPAEAAPAPRATELRRPKS